MRQFLVAHVGLALSIVVWSVEESAAAIRLPSVVTSLPLDKQAFIRRRLASTHQASSLAYQSGVGDWTQDTDDEPTVIRPQVPVSPPSLLCVLWTRRDDGAVAATSFLRRLDWPFRSFILCNHLLASGISVP